MLFDEHGLNPEVYKKTSKENRLHEYLGTYFNIYSIDSIHPLDLPKPEFLRIINCYMEDSVTPICRVS